VSPNIFPGSVIPCIWMAITIEVRHSDVAST
jgi:hypothetical protein